MSIRVWAMSVLLWMTFACGDDKGDDGSATPSAGKGGAGGAKPSSAGAGSAAIGSGVPSGVMPVQCGSTMCQGSGPLAQFLMPCCADAATSTCGMASLTGGGCTKPAVSDPRCPEVDLMGVFKLASCCTNDRCGIDASMFGMAGCSDLAMVASLPTMGFITFPAPRSCSGVVDDAGVDDAGK